MIFGKANLSIASIASTDKNVNVLNNVLLSQDGSSCATDGTMLVAVSPLPRKVRKHSLIKDGNIKEDFTISTKSIDKLLKGLPKDLEFGGLLEMISIVKKKATDILCKFTDGKNDTTLQVPTSRFEYPDFKKVISDVKSKDSVNICIHRGRLIKLLDTIDKASGGNSLDKPIYLEYNQKTGGVVLRCKNEKTNQNIVGIMQSFLRHKKDWLKESRWERKSFKYKKVK